MTNDIARFDQFVSSAPARIEAALTTDEVQQVLSAAKVLAAAARAAKNREYEEMAKTVEHKALNRLGRMMAAQRDAGDDEGGGRPTENRGNENPVLERVGIDKNLAKAARKAYPEGWPIKPKPPRMTPSELQSAGYSPKTERYDTGGGESKSRIKLISDENRSLKAENAKLKEEVFRLNSDLAAIQTGQIMQMSRAALEQRKAIIAKAKTKRETRLATETAPDEKTKEDYERQIQRLKTQVNTERAKAASITMQRDALRAFSRDDRKFLLVFSHPDGATDPAEKAKRERAFKLINSIPEADA